ncbi:zinc finger protein 704-like [Tachypleus tridentatus]|uniref:zinc finger protein 704-like n=1 Tax=Tachypleus tridentatus TaxID=6853 RepID=UPI003FD52BDA
MSTGKRLAKRSVLGTRVCAQLEDGRYYPGVIQATKTGENSQENIYCVQFEDRNVREFMLHELIGPGFQSVHRVKLKNGQRVYVTYQGREVVGIVDHHRPNLDQVLITVEPSSHSPHVTKAVVLKKKLEEIRLVESRKSARLQDTDTDYSRLAEGQPETKKRPPSLIIDVPPLQMQSGRKRRPSSTDDTDIMNDCSAAMVLMSLSCSPKSPRLPNSGSYGYSWTSSTSSGFQGWDSSSSDTRTTTPSPPSPSLSVDTVATQNNVSSPGQVSDEGIEMDETVVFMEEPLSGKRKTRILFQCTWPGCGRQYHRCEDVEKHVRMCHLRHSTSQPSDSCDDHEEEFYYTEIELDDQQSPPASPEGSTENVLLSPGLTNIYTSSAPTLSHLDMVKPPHENPEYRDPQDKKLILDSRVSPSKPVSIPKFHQPIIHWQPYTHAVSALSDMVLSPKYVRLSPKSVSPPAKLSTVHKRGRSEIRKCRKVYGMENRELWCTQCRWKKACTRFVTEALTD